MKQKSSILVTWKLSFWAANRSADLRDGGGCIGAAVGSNHSKNDLPNWCSLKLKVSKR
jgi:hypothetical protein